MDGATDSINQMCRLFLGYFVKVAMTHITAWVRNGRQALAAGDKTRGLR